MVLLLSGCAGASMVVDAFRTGGFTESDRKSLLPERLELFTHALYWGKGEALLAFANPSGLEHVRSLLPPDDDSEKIVATKVARVEFSPDAFEATVTIVVKAYKVPVYTIQERREILIWKYTTVDGWKIS